MVKKYSTALDITGGALVCLGVGLFSIPIAIILAGVVLVAMSWVANR